MDSMTGVLPTLVQVNYNHFSNEQSTHQIIENIFIIVIASVVTYLLKNLYGN